MLTLDGAAAVTFMIEASTVMLGDALLGGGLAFLIAVISTPVGVSGAVFLVPVVSRHPGSTGSPRRSST
ncbi:MAG: hypothetical protein JST59_23365 [Actinobacteria bacterium]|nr:hypothetical protein [Actinomycetota bacterium]